jgi:hypothetical protein
MLWIDYAQLRLATSPADVAGALECFHRAIDIARGLQLGRGS